MVGFLKHFNQKIGKTVSMFMVFVLTAYALYRGLSSDAGFITYLKNFIMVVIFAAMVILAIVKNKQLLAHVVLLIAFYNESVSDFFNWVLSIGSNNFKFDVQVLIMVLISLYLLLQIVSMVLAGVKLEIKWSRTLGLVSLLIVFFSLSYPITESLALVLIPLLAIMMGAPLVATLGVIASTIVYPVDVIYSLFKDLKLNGVDIFNVVLATLLLVFAVYHMVKLIQKKQSV